MRNYYRLIDTILEKASILYHKHPLQNIPLCNVLLLEVLKLAHLRADLEVLFKTHKLVSFLWREINDFEREKQNLVMLRDIAGMMQASSRKDEAYQLLG